MRRLPVVIVAMLVVALAGVATFVALRPFDITIDLGGHAQAFPVAGTCDAAATTALQDGSKDQLALWAVTVGTNMMGYTPVFGKSVKYVLIDGKEKRGFPGPYCVGEARHRLIWSGTILAIGIAIVTAGVYLIRRRAYVLR